MSEYINMPAPASGGSVPPQQYQASPKTSGLGIASLVLGILGFCFLPFALAGLIMGIVSMNQIKKSQGRITGKGLALAGVILSSISMVVSAIALITVFSKGGLEGADTSGKIINPEATVQSAESNIITHHKSNDYSNSEAGLELSKAFTTMFKDLSLESTDDLKERHEFVTHCQLHDDSVVFLTHVPKLRKFDDESKERFCEMAWLTAQLVKRNSGIPAGIDLAVGVKGNVLYQNIYLGKTGAEVDEASFTAGVTEKTKSSGKLGKYFKGPDPEQELEVSFGNPDAPEQP